MPMLIHNKSALYQAWNFHQEMHQPRHHTELPVISEARVETEMENLHGWAGNIMLMVELRKKILIFRDFIDLPPCDPSIPIHNLMMITVEDLHKLYPNIKLQNLSLEKAEASIQLNEGLINLYNALKPVEASWAKNNNWISSYNDSTEDLENDSLDQLGGRVLTKLHHMIKIAQEMFDMMDGNEEDEEEGMQGAIFRDIYSESYSGNTTTCPSPDTPTMFSPEDSFIQPFLLPHGIQAVRQLKLLNNNMRCFSFDRLINKHGYDFGKDINKEDKKLKVEVEEMDREPSVERIHGKPTDSNAMDDNSNRIHQARSAGDVKAPAPPPPPPPPLPTPSNSSPPHDKHSQSPLKPTRPPAPPIASKGLAPPPPPPGGMTKALRAKKANAKLKRSTQMSRLYQVLKGKVEGRNLGGNLSQGRKAQLGKSPDGKQGMAEAIAEMTKRSMYFHEIEEDVRKYRSSIAEVKVAILNFQTKDMAELVKFHRYVEQHLEKLTDETQVLARFEDFPTKKLEVLRMAAALYSRLEGIRTELESWKVEPPLNKFLDKIESYFSKIKEEIDALERSKDEDAKRFQSHKIDFDFGILVRIKESTVDVSSSCMELALKERREINAISDAEKGSKADIKAKACMKMLWRAFQLAFRVYNFAGGQDDRADQLSRELAQEIEADPQKE